MGRSSSLCSLLLQNYSTEFSNADTHQWGNNVDLQHILHFDLHPSMTAGQGHEILQFCEIKCLTCSSLCSLLLRNYLTDFSNADTNLPREQCRFATYTSFWPSPFHDCRSRSRNTSILWILVAALRMNANMSGPYKVTGNRLNLVALGLFAFVC